MGFAPHLDATSTHSQDMHTHALRTLQGPSEASGTLQNTHSIQSTLGSLPTQGMRVAFARLTRPPAILRRRGRPPRCARLAKACQGFVLPRLRIRGKASLDGATVKCKEVGAPAKGGTALDFREYWQTKRRDTIGATTAGVRLSAQLTAVMCQGQY